MTFRDFIERSFNDFEEHLRRDGVEDPTIEMRARGARQFASMLLGDMPSKSDAPRKRSPAGRAPLENKGGDPSTRRFGGPR